MVEVALARTSPASLRISPSTKAIDLPLHSIQASAMMRPGVAGLRKLTLISSDKGLAGELHDAAGMAHVQARAIVDHGVSAFAAIDHLFHAERVCHAVPLDFLFLRLLVHSPGDSTFDRWTGADSAIISMAMTLSTVARSRYQAGASGLSVTWMSQAMIGCVVPPNTAMELA